MKRIAYKTDQNHPQILEYKRAVERGMLNQHVLPRDDGSWAVKRADSQKATQIFSTQREAISLATTIARNQGTALFIHGKDGRIKDRMYFDS